jgi:hypothetical protein
LTRYLGNAEWQMAMKIKKIENGSGKLNFVSETIN